MWLSVPGATLCNVHRAGAPGMTPGSAGLTNSQTYYLVVTAVDAAAESGALADIATNSSPDADNQK